MQAAPVREAAATAEGFVKPVSAGQSSPSAFHSLLVLKATGDSHLGLPNAVHCVSPGILKQVVIPEIARRKAEVAMYACPEARSAYQLYAAQDPCEVTTFDLPGERHSRDLLPGGLPIIDHLVEWLPNDPGWDEQLYTIAAQTQTKRMPSIDPRLMPEVCAED
jgi:hypothetical protein